MVPKLIKTLCLVMLGLAAGMMVACSAVDQAVNKNISAMESGADDQGSDFGEGNITRTVLDNGLVVIIKEVHTSPVVAIQTWVKAGSIYEEGSLGYGMSHFLEHMAFKGTEKYGVGEIAREIEGEGGYLNAYTSLDKTVYVITIESSKFEKALGVQADAVMNSVIDGDELEKERQVIINEINMNRDKPERYLSWLFWETAFNYHPYRHPVIGYKELVEKLSRETVYNYYKKFYVPNNMAVVVIGDVDTDEALTRVKEAYGSYERGPDPLKPLPVEPEQTGERRLVVREPISKAYLEIGYHIPSIHSQDVYPLDLLAMILGQGRSSRLVRKLKEEQELVDSVNSWCYTPKYPGIFAFNVVCDPANVDKVETAIEEELELVKTDLINSWELERVKAQVISSRVFGLQNVEDQASDLGSNEIVINDIGYSERYPDEIRKVTAEDISRVAEKYFTRTNKTFAAVMPEAAKAESKAVRKEKRAGNKTRKILLDNGLTVLFQENHDLPIITLQLVGNGGLLYEDAERNGIFNLCGNLLLKGTDTRTAYEISDTIEGVGGSIGTFSGNNSFGVRVALLSDYVHEGMDILGDVVRNSNFPEEQFEKEKALILSGISIREDNIRAVAVDTLRKSFFQDHPYKLRTLGTTESVSAISRQDILDCYGAFCRPDNMILSVYGDIDEAGLRRLLDENLSGWEAGPGIAKKAVPQVTPPANEDIRISMDKAQVVIMGGFPGVDVSSEDRPAIEVMSKMLSEMGARLFIRLRDEQGLAYYVGAYPILGVDPGMFIFYMGTTPDNTEHSLAALKKEVERLKSEPILEEELENAKRSVLGNDIISRQDITHRAFNDALNELYGLGYDYDDVYEDRIKAVTTEDLSRIARKYFKTEWGTWVIAGSIKETL